MAQTCDAMVETGLVEGLLTSADCHISNLVQTGYAGLAGPQSHLVGALTAVLVIYVGVLGLRLMLGLGALRVGDLTMAAVKIGVVLALATNWPLYHRLVFETLFNGPEQLAGELLMGSASAKPIDALRGALQMAFDEMQASALFYAQKTPGAVSPWIGGSGFGAAALNLSSVLMLASTIGALLALRIVLAALLVAGPIFLGFFLFQSTRGVFLGWLRAALGLAFAPLFALLALVLQLELVQPQLAALAALRAQGGADIGPAVAVLVITLTTALVTLVGLVACGAVGLSLRFPGRAASAAAGPGATTSTASAGVREQPASAAPNAFDPPPRIAAVAAAAAALERREGRTLNAPVSYGRSSPSTTAGSQVAWERAVQSSAARRRPAQPLASAGSLRRDA